MKNSNLSKKVENLVNYSNKNLNDKNSILKSQKRKKKQNLKKKKIQFVSG